MWPAEPVRDLLEGDGTPELAESLMRGRINRRGVTARDPASGGKKDRQLAQQHRAWAREVEHRWPSTARLLDRFADDYEREATEEDAFMERWADER